MENSKLCLVVGVGPATGLAIVERFAAEYEIAMMARDQARLSEIANRLEHCHAYPCNVGHTDELEETVSRIQEERGHPDVLIHNAVRGTFGPFTQIDVEGIEKNFRINGSSFLRLVQLLSPAMVDKKAGAICATGNTAAYRGVPNFSAFAPTKAAQRILAESMARLLGPQGVHVSFLAIDAVISTPTNLKAMPNQPEEYFAHPRDIAEEVWHLVHQPKSSWTFDAMIRPFGEKW